MWCVAVLFLITQCFLFINAEDVIVTIPDGKIRGTLVTSARKQKGNFYAFQEIPYAKPPTGNLRFQSPLPAEKWSGILNATKSTKICYQTGTTNDYGLTESEDCLVLNVYTPKNPNLINNLPVLVWIHGGGFLNGAGSYIVFSPHLLMDYDIIVVSINYRVGPFGFLSTGDSVIPGNYGLKDQNLALKWIKSNIKYFGGDPNKVTIFGGSAGGASVAFHLQSKLSRGLFRAAITESGSTLIGWSYQRNHKHMAFSLAQKINRTVNTSSDLLRILKNTPAQTIKQASANLFSDLLGDAEYDAWMNGFGWTPSIEVQHSEAFVTQYQYEAIESGEMARVPLMMGIASEEMLSRANVPIEVRAAIFDKNPTVLISDNMHLNKTDQRKLAGKAIQEIYGPFTAKPYEVIKFYTDTVFARPLITHAKLQSKFSDVYFYEFSYHGEMGGGTLDINGCEKVEHGEDGNYIWAHSGTDDKYDSYPQEDRTTSERYRTLLTNFVKYLNPTPKKTQLLQNIEWPTVKPSSFRYLNINNSLSIESDFKKNVYDKWIKVYDTYGIRPFDTY